MTAAIEVSPEATLHVDGGDMYDGPIEAVTYKGGEFSVELDGVMSRMVSLTFVLASVGLNYNRTANLLHLSPHTVKNHMRKSLAATSASRVTLGIHTAFSLGLFDVVEPIKRTPELTPAQMSVLEGVAQGMSIPEVARATYRGVDTAKARLDEARDRLQNAPNVAAFVTIAHLSGTLAPDQRVIDYHAENLSHEDIFALTVKLS